MKQKAERVLIFNVNWLGDVLFSTAAIRNIRRNFPGSFIACIVPSRCYPILKGNPHLDEVLIFDERDRHKGLQSKLEFIQLLRRKKFDLAFLLHRSFTRSLICRLAGIPQRIGYYTPKRGFLLTHKIKPPRRDSVHRIDYYLHLIEKAGFRVEDRFPEFFLAEEDAEAVDAFFAKHNLGAEDFVVGINPGGNWQPKRWPLERWAELAERLIAERGAKVIITGSSGDTAKASHMKQAMRRLPIIACGVFNIRQSAALFKRLDLFITADTGPLHIANAAGARHIIALFGPTHPAITGPYPEKNTVILRKEIGCKVPCYVVNCKDNRCMKAISVDEVIEQVKLLRTT